jgi:hypothetical protein
MDVALVIKVILALAAMAGVAKIIYEFSAGGKLRLKDEYRFAKEFLNELSSNEKLHHLAIERGYYALAGTSSIKVSEIKYLISLTSPDRRLKDYVLSRKYVELKQRSNRIDFRDKYKSGFSRVWRKIVFVSVYFVGSCLAFSPLLLIKPFGLEPKFMLLILVTLPCFGFFAVDSMRGFVKIVRGEALVKEQEEHAPLIYVKTEHKKPSSVVTPV